MRNSASASAGAVADAPRPSLKLALRDHAARALFWTGRTAAARRPRQHLVAVTFHRVLPRGQIAEYPFPGLCVTPDELGWFLAQFAPAYECLPFGEAAARHREGRSRRPLLAITFDDGALDNVEHAAPVLEAAGVRATFFLPVEAIERREALWHDELGFAVQALPPPDAATPDHPGSARTAVARAKAMPAAERRRWIDALRTAAPQAEVPAWASLMSWEDARALRDAGHEIGSHSMSHDILTGCSDAALHREIADSKRDLETRLGPIESFCYPNGDHDARCHRELAAAGYRQACTTAWGDNPPGTPPFVYRRFDMDAARVRSRHGALSPALLAWRMSRWFRGPR
ncbi:MAG: polysaccharide deacetylase family protein [Planctomycetota bacterium]